MTETVFDPLLYFENKLPKSFTKSKNFLDRALMEKVKGLYI